jgi:hypothetical protein
MSPTPHANASVLLADGLDQLVTDIERGAERIAHLVCTGGWLHERSGCGSRSFQQFSATSNMTGRHQMGMLACEQQSMYACWHTRTFTSACATAVITEPIRRAQGHVGGADCEAPTSVLLPQLPLSRGAHPHHPLGSSHGRRGARALTCVPSSSVAVHGRGQVSRGQAAACAAVGRAHGSLQQGQSWPKGLLVLATPPALDLTMWHGRPHPPSPPTCSRAR